MAVVWITEYRELAADKAGHPVACGQEPPQATQCIAEGGESQPFAAGTKFIRVLADRDVHVALGPERACESDMPLPAWVERFYGVSPGLVLTFRECET